MSNNQAAALALLTLWFALAPTEAQAAQIRGRVTLKGKVPSPQVIPIEPKKGSHSTEGCGRQKFSPGLRVDEKGNLQNAVVWLDLPTQRSAAASTDSVILDQRACEFEPHVVLVTAGGTLAIHNGDGVLHNVRIFKEGKPSFLMHQWQKADAPAIHWRFNEPGRYVVRCGIHPWMHAWVVAADHPHYTLTNVGGEFTLQAVPPGRYRLHVWHETLGIRELPLQVGQGDVQVAPIAYEVKGAS